MRSLRRNKKGSLLDIVFIMVVLFFFGFVTLIGFKIAFSFDEQIQSMDVFPATSKTASTQMVGHYSGTIDGMFLFLTIGLAIGALVLAALVRVHPIFIPFFLIALIAVITIAGILANIYDEMARNTLLASEASQLTFMSTILTYLPLIIGVIGIILMVVMYKLWSAEIT